MFKIKTMNAISPVGLETLEKLGCAVSADAENPDGMLIRSADLHGYEFNPELLGIARAGAGYNNIPIEECAERGIVVFNSPGANGQGAGDMLPRHGVARRVGRDRLGQDSCRPRG